MEDDDYLGDDWDDEDEDREDPEEDPEMETDSIEGCCVSKVFYGLGGHGTRHYKDQEEFDKAMFPYGTCNGSTVNIAITNYEQDPAGKFLTHQGWTPVPMKEGYDKITLWHITYPKLLEYFRGWKAKNDDQKKREQAEAAEKARQQKEIIEARKKEVEEQKIAQAAARIESNRFRANTEVDMNPCVTLADVVAVFRACFPRYYRRRYGQLTPDEKDRLQIELRKTFEVYPRIDNIRNDWDYTNFRASIVQLRANRGL